MLPRPPRRNVFLHYELIHNVDSGFPKATTKRKLKGHEFIYVIGGYASSSIHISLLVGMSTAMLSFGQSFVSSSDEPSPHGQERVRWVFQSTLGPMSLLGASTGAQ